MLPLITEACKREYEFHILTMKSFYHEYKKYVITCVCTYGHNH